MNSKELMEYWTKSSDDDFKTMEHLYESEDYSWCLFIGHLVIEKLLKGLYAKENPNDPYAIKSHDLVLLANKCNLNLTNEQNKILYTITTFNISARYSDYKDTFKEKCTREYTTNQLKYIKETSVWIKKLVEKC